MGIGLLFSACIAFAQVSSPSVTEPVVPAPRSGSIGPMIPAGINPLTGQEAPPEALARLPMIVKISNSPPVVRPQYGLGEADLVFEHYTEVGITRFSAIFLGNAPQRVGSVRSARLIDYELAPMYDALLAFAGASLGVDKRIYGTEHVVAQVCRGRDDADQCRQDVMNIGPAGDIPPSDFVARAFKGTYYGPPLFVRDEAIPMPHNMFADTQAIWARAARQGISSTANLDGMVFHPQPPPNPEGRGIYAQVRYATTLAEWHYEPESGRYYRSTDGIPHFDALTDEQISAANVIVLYVGHYLTDIVESGGGENVHWSEQITLWPQGRGLLLRDGQRYELVWRRPQRSDLLTFWRKDGITPLELKPGNTFFQVVRLPEQMNPDVEWVIVD